MTLVRKSLLLLALMLAAFGSAIALRPTVKIADERPPIDLKTLIPTQFGEWREEAQNNIYVVNPQQKEVLDKIYSETLSRTYINAQGYRIMLSVAYGADQRRATQVHKPEVCYPAQGFQLKGSHAGILATPFGELHVRRLSTSLGQRHEPVTYWIIVGDRTITSGINKKLVEMSFGFSGRIPDGLLFRVSSIDTNDNIAFAMQAAFLNQLLDAATPEARYRLSGLGATAR